MSALSIENFKILSPTKILMGFEELEIKRIAVNVNIQYYKSYIYVEAKGECSVGLREYSKEDIENQVASFGYASEQYALLGDYIISPQESDDGAAVINGEVIDASDSEVRIRYLSDYNFIISAKQSPYNSPKFEDETTNLFNDILKGNKKPEDLFAILNTFVKNQRSRR